jgi:hypothetical protein
MAKIRIKYVWENRRFKSVDYGASSVVHSGDMGYTLGLFARRPFWTHVGWLRNTDLLGQLADRPFMGPTRDLRLAAR